MSFKTVGTVLSSLLSITAVISGFLLLAQALKLSQIPAPKAHSQDSISLSQASTLQAASLPRLASLDPLPRTGRTPKDPQAQERDPVIRISLKNPNGAKVPLRKGPGDTFPKAGDARPYYQYLVQDLEEGWFKVITPGKLGDEFAWIPSHLTETSSH